MLGTGVGLMRWCLPAYKKKNRKYPPARECSRGVAGAGRAGRAGRTDGGRTTAVTLFCGAAPSTLPGSASDVASSADAASRRAGDSARRSGGRVCLNGPPQ